MSKVSRYKLSICIPTYNRANLLRQALESVVPQLTRDCEIVISDNASSDNTEQVAAEYVCRLDNIRYAKQKENVGLDRNFDRAVELASGEYCWLLPDDDVMLTSAVETVLRSLNADYSLVIANTERRDFELSNVLHRLFTVSENVEYGPDEFDRLFRETGQQIIACSCVIIRRDIWLQRDRARYYGSMFIHIGVIFQRPLPGSTLLIADPLVAFRDGHRRSFWSEMFEIGMVKWPETVWSLGVSDAAKNAVCKAEPWRSVRLLMIYRAFGLYSMNEYRRWIRPRLRSLALAPALVALIPGVLVNIACEMYYCVARVPDRRFRLLYIRRSRFNLRNWRVA